MKVNEVVRHAKLYVQELYREEDISNLGLEEVEFNEGSGVWSVTLGFSRPWNAVRNAMVALTGDAAPRRVYKVLSVQDSDGEVVSLKNRDQKD